MPKKMAKRLGASTQPFFHAISDGEGVRQVAAMIDLTLLAYMELLNDGEEL